MAVRFRWSGGQFQKNVSPTFTGGGYWATNGTTGGSIVSNAPGGRATTYAAFSGGSFTGSLTTPTLPGGAQSGLIAGYAVYVGQYTNNFVFIAFRLGASNQCEVRMNGSGQLYFTRNGTNLGAGNPTVSTNALTVGGWHYVEFKA